MFFPNASPHSYYKQQASTMPRIATSVFLSHLLLSAAAFCSVPPWRRSLSAHGRLLPELSASPVEQEGTTTNNAIHRNEIYVQGLLETLQSLLDKYICNGSKGTSQRALNVLDQIALQTQNGAYTQQAVRMVKRAGLPVEASYFDKYAAQEEAESNSDSDSRREEFTNRQQWEDFRRSTAETGSKVARSTKKPGERSMARTPNELKSFADSKRQLQADLEESPGNSNSSPAALAQSSQDATPLDLEASLQVSELVATAGAGSAFEGETLGIGGLDDVLAQVKRRIWIPLAAPPQLLDELGIHPVRGLLLYGKPGCGKTLLAKKLGRILSPMRPITIVSGPELMDKFVGSSEKNLRMVFDNPPDIYDTYRIGQSDGGEAIARAAIHVIVMDEFDAMARTRGGRGGAGDQGDAGVARDSVVNQMLAKMDGVQPLPVPTLVVGLTNKRSLIEPALLRPGRFEVQIEVPPPRSVGQRVSVLKVHTKSMWEAGRVLVSDPPENTTAWQHVQNHGRENLLSYEDLLSEIARMATGFSGASLAGVARAAASHALERAVSEYAENALTEPGSHNMMSCLVTKEDFYEAIEDVLSSAGASDHSDDEEIDKEGA